MAGWLDPKDVDISSFIVLVLSLVFSVVVLYMNARAWRGLRDVQEWRRPQVAQARILAVSTILAVLATLTAAVAYGAPRAMIPVQPKPNGPFISVQAPALWAALLFVCILAIVVALNAYTIWQSYLCSAAILEKTVRQWKPRVVYGYLVFIFALLLLHHIPYQIQVQRSPVLKGPMRYFFLSIVWILTTFIGHVSFFAVFGVVAIADWIRSGEPPANEAADQHTMVGLQSLAMRSLIHIAFSILAYILVWLAALLRPLDVQLHVSVPPFCLVIMLLCHGCFVAPTLFASSAPAVAAVTAGGDAQDVKISLEERTSEEAAPVRRAVIEVPSDYQERPRRAERKRRGAAMPLPDSSSSSSGRRRVAGSGGTGPSNKSSIKSMTSGRNSGGFSHGWDEGYQTQSFPPSVASDRASKGSSSSNDTSSGGDFMDIEDYRSSSTNASRKSNRSQSSSPSSKAASSGEPVAAIAIVPSPSPSPGATGRDPGTAVGFGRSSWRDLFSARRERPPEQR